MRARVFSISGTLSENSIAVLADAAFRSPQCAGTSETLRFDLQKVPFAEPYGVVVLAAIVERLARDGHSIEVVCPKDQNCALYLAACGFLSSLAPFAALVGGEAVAYAGPSSASSVLPLQMMTGELEIQGVLERILGDLRLQSNQRTLDPLAGIIKEICANVFHHSAYPVGWIGGQRYRNRAQQRDYIELAIADAGQGIRASLGTRFPNLLGAAEGLVIAKMLTEHLSASGNPSRGNGYFILQEAARQLDGQFSLRSGSGAIIRPRHGELRRREDLASWPGTQLKVRLSISG